MTEEEQTQEQNTEQTQETNTNGLIVIANGAVAESKPLNDNFSYLNARADSLKQNIDAVRDALDDNVKAKTQAFLDKAFYNVKTFPSLNQHGSLSLEVNSIYKITPTDVVTFVLPSVPDTTKFYQILVQVNIASDKIGAISADDNRLGTNYYFDATTPQFALSGCYNIYYEYDNLANMWCCGALYKGVVS